MFEKCTNNTHLLESEARRKRQRNIEYLLSLEVGNLLRPFYNQAGLSDLIPKGLTPHYGWDAEGSHIRGTFTSHWLSAAAYTYAETKNEQLKERADFIVGEIRRCQIKNGGVWCFPIPENYIKDVLKGQWFWAPQYVCHKVMMGLLDMYKMTGNELALQIVEDAAPWFLEFGEEISREEMTRLMDLQETGGILELWADLYGLLKKPIYKKLIKIYERPSLYEPLLNGEDPLTNMHANTTIPEIQGAARAYEVTGEERYRKIVEAYWKCAVDDRGYFATGGQTSGEVWTPKNKQASRLGEFNQEHCTVYNMIRLADYLYQWTGDKKYTDYIERNIINGIYAQGHFDGQAHNGVTLTPTRGKGLICYYLPLEPGAKKHWGSHDHDFWCCHCSLIQVHSRLREFIYYKTEKMIDVAQYIPSVLEVVQNGVNVKLTQRDTDVSGDDKRVNPISSTIDEKPSFYSYDFHIEAEKKTEFTLRLRVPFWTKDFVKLTINGEEIDLKKNVEELLNDGWIEITREWENDKVTVAFGKRITCWPLPDQPETVAFMDGPVVLAGLVEEERMLYGDIEHPETMIQGHDARMWTKWNNIYRTFRQPVGFKFRPLNEIGYETYTVYFPVEKKD